jgi:hypothetical protein
MSDTHMPGEAGGTPAQGAILALDLAILFDPVPAEAHAYVAHMATCADAIGSVFSSAKLPASVSVEITRQLSANDTEWFESNPERSYRYRNPIPGEWLQKACAELPPHIVLVRQVSKGARLLAPVWLKVDAATSVERFEAARNQKQLDNDDVLALVFDVYCAFPGEPIDILNLLRSVGQHAWYRMVTQASRALAAPAS